MFFSFEYNVSTLDDVYSSGFSLISVETVSNYIPTISTHDKNYSDKRLWFIRIQKQIYCVHLQK